MAKLRSSLCEKMQQNINNSGNANLHRSLKPNESHLNMGLPNASQNSINALKRIEQKTYKQTLTKTTSASPYTGSSINKDQGGYFYHNRNNFCLNQRKNNFF
jgi:hypothetical protein